MSVLKQWIPRWMKSWRRPPDFVYQSTNQNIYHCTVQKSASQWVRGILSDPRTFRHCGLTSHQYQHLLPEKYDSRKLTERRFMSAFPARTIATPIYIDYDGFASIPKPAHYKAFFVMRDPRDIVISWYFSTKFSHKALGDIERIRQELDRLPEENGLLFTIDHLESYGLFQAQRSWIGADAKDVNVLLMPYEDMIGEEQISTIEALMKHCDIRLPGDELVQILKSHSFEELTGRRRGDEDVHAHYRKGVAGDWRNHFTPTIEKRVLEVAGDVLESWNYA